MRITKKLLPTSNEEHFIRIDLMPEEAQEIAGTLQMGVDESRLDSGWALAVDFIDLVDGLVP